MTPPKDLYDSKKRPVRLGDQVGRGGEAAIYALAVQPVLLAKVFHQLPRDDYDQKLAWMQSHPPEDPTLAKGHASIAWPSDLLYDGSGKLAGYVMVRVQNAVPLLQVFNPRLRAKTLPAFDRRYLHRTARNLASALGALHDSGYVVGDMNESNIMVTPSAMVTLIDTDSFQVRRRSGAKPILHPCPVGKAEYTPPELQGKTFAETARLPEHDRFGLGVLIFQLLLEGNHPFRAQWLGQGDAPPVEDRIRDGHWPYVRRPSIAVVPPPGAPPLESLHPDLAELARQCFVDGHADPRRRPAPEVWERVIISAEKQLIACGNGHYYSRHLPHCGECRAQERAAKASAQAARAAPQPTRRAPPSKAAVVGGAAGRAMRQFLPKQVKRAIARVAAPAPAGVACQRCGARNRSDEVYCQQCLRVMGAAQPCSRCRRAVPEHARFCPSCGWRV